MWRTKINWSKDGPICTNYQYTIKDYYIQPEPRIYTFLCLDSALPPVFVVRREPRNWELETVDQQGSQCSSPHKNVNPQGWKYETSVTECLVVLP